MMKQNNPRRRLLAALLAALTLVSFTILPVLGAAEDEATDTEAAETTEATAPKAEETEMEIISISTEDDLIALAASCTLDAWSREKHVVLEADLDLTELTFSPIATFGGTFDGQGHTIRGAVHAVVEGDIDLNLVSGSANDEEADDDETK